MNNKYNLTDDEANILKDILKMIGQNDDLNYDVAAGLGMSESEFDEVAETIFLKLGNGLKTKKTI